MLRPAVPPARGRRISAPAAGARPPCRAPSAAGLRPVPRAAEPNDRPAVLLVPPVVGRLAVRRAPSVADGRAVRWAPAAACGRAVRRAPSAVCGRVVRRAPSLTGGRAVRRVSPSLAGGRVVRRAPSLAGGRAVRRVPPSPRAAVSPRARSRGDVRVVRRGPSPPAVRGARRGPSPVVLSLPVPARPLRGCCLARPDAGRPRPWLVDLLVPADVGLLPGFPVPVPEEARDVFGIPPPARPPLLRPPPLVSRPLGAPRPSATPTNLQHLPPRYPDKRRGPLDHIGSDPLQSCPAASYSPTRSPAQYHRR